MVVTLFVLSWTHYSAQLKCTAFMTDCKVSANSDTRCCEWGAQHLDDDVSGVHRWRQAKRLPGGCKTMHFHHKNQGGVTEVTGCSQQHCKVKVVGIIAVVLAMRHGFQAWWILCHSSAFSSWGWLKQLPNRLTGIFGSPGESLSGRLIGYSRIANLCYLTA